MEILVSAEAAPRVSERIPSADRLLCMDRDGTIRVGSETVPSSEAHPDVAWLTPDVLLDLGFRQLFLDVVLGTDAVRWVQSAAAGTDVPAFHPLLARGPGCQTRTSTPFPSPSTSWPRCSTTSRGAIGVGPPSVTTSGIRRNTGRSTPRRGW